MPGRLFFQLRPALVLVCAVLLSSAIATATAADFVVEHDVMVSMRDGVQLATDVYRPASDGKALDEPLPVILTRTPYGKSGAAGAAEYFATHGYVFVAQDTRGRYGSQGVWHMLSDDGRDGVDCAAWIGKQAWSNGKIGMIGTSYVGGTQHALALEHAPELKTVIPVDAMSNLGRQSMRNAGAFELRFWNWIFLNAGRGSRAARDPGTAEALKQMADQRRTYLANLPTRRGTTPLKLAPEYEAWLVAAMEHGANDAFWAQNNIVDAPERYQDMPVYLVSGWYDSWGGNNTANYMTLSKTLRGPVYLIMGPWIHGGQSGYAHGQVTFGRDAAIADQYAWRKEWYDHWLMGLDNSVGKAAPFATPVRIFVMGTGNGGRDEQGRLVHGGYWRDEHEWPLARTHYTDFYLTAGGGLSREKPDNDGGTSQFQFDPRDPVPTIGGNISSGNDILLQGAWDQKGGPHVWNFTEPVPISSRNDVVVFESEPLEADLEVTGEIEVRLFASSSAVDTDFTAKLIDVYPPSADWPGGFDLNIGDGIVRARFRDSLKEEKLMTPGEVYEFTIKLYPTSNVFKRGHRIRVDVSSSNFPRFDVNPNTGEPLGRQRLSQVARQTIYHDAAHPSRIILPVIPANRAQPTATLPVSEGTGEKPQSKIWKHGGNWFAALPDASGTWIWRLDGSEWTRLHKLADSSRTHADARTVGGVTHVLLFDGGKTQLASVAYDRATRSYDAWSSRPDNVDLPLPEASETATIDVDSRGRMWVAYENKPRHTVEVRYSDGDYSRWSEPITLAEGLADDDIAAVASLANRQIGVFWSNQNTKRFGFRTHDDGADPSAWSAAESPADESALDIGDGLADDHMNLACASDGTLYVAVKTSYDTAGKPLIALLVRRPGGSWDPLYEVSDRGTRPVVTLDEARGRAIVAYTSGQRNIVYRETPTSSISFGPVRTLITGGRLSDVTTSKQLVVDDVLFVASAGSKARGTLLSVPETTPSPAE